MAIVKRFPAGKTPYIRRADVSTNTNLIMRDFLIALLPLVVFAWIKNGLLPFIAGDCGLFGMLYPLIFVAVGTLSGFIVEGLYFLIFKKEKDWS